MVYATLYHTMQRAPPWLQNFADKPLRRNWHEATMQSMPPKMPLIPRKARRSIWPKSAFSKGLFAEDAACRHLKAAGYAILGQRIKPPRGSGAGEIDILAQDHDTLVLVEVKYRGSHDDAAYALTPQQQKRLQKAAEWLLGTPYAANTTGLRFDAITLDDQHTVNHIPDAFRPW
jgi:putative endonuclease